MRRLLVLAGLLALAGCGDGAAVSGGGGEKPQIVVSAASSMNLLPWSSICCRARPVSLNISPSSRTTTLRLSLSTDDTNWSSSMSRSASSTGIDFWLPSRVSPASA